MSASSLEARLKALQKANKSCFNCCTLGTAYVVPAYGIFVCTECSGKHMSAGHRVISVSMGKFTPEQVKTLEATGNEVAWRTYLSKWKGERDTPRPTDRDGRKTESWIRAVFSEKRYYSETPEAAEPAADVSRIPVKDVSELLGKNMKLQVSSGSAGSPLTATTSAPVQTTKLVYGPAAAATNGTTAAPLLPMQEAASAPPPAKPVAAAAAAPAPFFDPFAVSSPAPLPLVAVAAPPITAATARPLSDGGAWSGFGTTSSGPTFSPSPAATPPAAAAAAPARPLAASVGSFSGSWNAFEDATPRPAAAPAAPAAGPATFAPWGVSSSNGQTSAPSPPTVAKAWQSDGDWSHFDESSFVGSISGGTKQLATVAGAAPAGAPGSGSFPGSGSSLHPANASSGALPAAANPAPSVSSQNASLSSGSLSPPAAWSPGTAAATDGSWNDFEDASAASPKPPSAALNVANGSSAWAAAAAGPPPAVSPPGLLQGSSMARLSASSPAVSPSPASSAGGSSKMAELPCDLFSEPEPPPKQLPAASLYAPQQAVASLGRPSWQQQQAQGAAAASGGAPLAPPSWQPAAKPAVQGLPQAQPAGPWPAQISPSQTPFVSAPPAALQPSLAVAAPFATELPPSFGWLVAYATQQQLPQQQQQQQQQSTFQGFGVGLLPQFDNMRGVAPQPPNPFGGPAGAPFGGPAPPAAAPPAPNPFGGPPSAAAALNPFGGQPPAPNPFSGPPPALNPFGPSGVAQAQPFGAARPPLTASANPFA